MKNIIVGTGSSEALAIAFVFTIMKPQCQLCQSQFQGQNLNSTKLSTPRLKIHKANLEQVSPEPHFSNTKR